MVLLIATQVHKESIVTPKKAPPFPVITGGLPGPRQVQKTLTPAQRERLTRGFAEFLKAEKEIDAQRQRPTGEKIH